MKKRIFWRLMAIMLAVSLVLSYTSSTVISAAGFSETELAADSSEQTTLSTVEHSTSQTTQSNSSNEIVQSDTEISTQTIQEEQTTEYMEQMAETTEKVSETEPAQEVETMPPGTENISTKQSMQPIIEEGTYIRNKAAEDYPPAGVVLNSGSWGGGYYWYVYQGPEADRQRHYIFCLEQGAAMHGGMFHFKKRSGIIGTKKDTFRIAVAMDYFKQHGGWASESGYAEGQRVVWNTGGTSVSNRLLRYTGYLWELTSLNDSRASGSGSFSNVLTPIKSSEVTTAYKKKLNNRYCKATAGGSYTVEDCAVSLGGAAWKYFAAGAGGMGSIKIAGIYDAEGEMLSDTEAKASVGENGNLKVSFNATDTYGTKDAPITVVIGISGDYQGAASIEYLDCGSGKQKLSFDSEFESPAYFAVKLYTQNSITHYEGAAISVNKVDEFGKPVDGATFRLYCPDSDVEYDRYLNISSIDNSENTFSKIQKPGFYYLSEVTPPIGMNTKIPVICIEAEQVTENNITKIRLSIRNPEKLSSFYDITLDSESTALCLSFTAVNRYNSGNAEMKKVGNVFVKWENGEFVYRTRDLQNVSFQLYTAQDIWLEDTLLWEADTRLTQEVLDASIWNTDGKHNARIHLTTDKDAMLYFHNLPEGNYYVVETDSYDGYGILGSRLNFTITGENTEENPVKINDGIYENRPVDADCIMIKADKKNPDKKLAGAEFTLYAHIDNNNFDGYALFTAEQTEPAVVSRDASGNPRYVENTWIPLKTVKSNENGQADFNLKLPYGNYMAVETWPPEGYRYTEGESYTFTHSPSTNPTDYNSGRIFTHIVENEKAELSITIHKTGELLTDAKTEAEDYGKYRRLIYERLVVQDILFEIYDVTGTKIKTLKTDQKGIGESGALQPGTYTIREVDNGGFLKTAEPQTVVLEESVNKTLQQPVVVNIMNEALSTSFHIFKMAETAEEQMAGGLEASDNSEDLYSYPVRPIAGAVFAIFTRNDIKNYLGATVIKAGSCVGYTITDTNGIADFTGKLPNGSYYYKEIYTADDSRYQLDTASYDFFVKLAGEDIDMDLNKENPLLNRLFKGSINVIKTQKDKTVRLERVKFRLLDAKRNELGVFVTDENGEIHIKNLPVGVYYLQETETLDGYKLDDTMQQIDITKTNLNQVLRIENEAADRETVVKAARMIKGTANIFTGDKPLCLLIFLFLLTFTAVILFIIHCKKEEIRKMMQKIRYKIWMLAVVLSMGILFNSVGNISKAAGANAAAYNGPDGITLEIVINPENIFHEKIVDADALFINEAGVSKEIENEGAKFLYENNGGKESFTLISWEDWKSKKSYQLEGYGGIEAYVVPSQIHITGSYLYETYQGKQAEKLDITVPVTQINQNTELGSTHNLIIPQNSNIKTIIPGNFAGENFKIICYNKEVQMDKYIAYESEYENWKMFAEHFVVYYDSPLAAALRHTFSKGKIVEPNYMQGRISYALNGGKNSEIASSLYTLYTIGKTEVIDSPVRENYRFEGWYTDKELAGHTRLEQNEDGKSILNSSITSAGEEIKLYAGWEYFAHVTRAGICYIIGENKTGTVVNGNYNKEVMIAPFIVYDGKKYPVTTIAEDAFKNADIYSVHIPSSVNTIKKGAFAGSSVREVYIDSLILPLGDCFPKNITLYTYADSNAYRDYKKGGYIGKAVPYESNIVYVLNGGKNNVLNPDTYTWKSYLTLAEPQKENNRFDGWYIDAGFQPASKVEVIEADTYKNIILYAKWTPLSAKQGESVEVVGTDTSPKENINELNKKMGIISAVVYPGKATITAKSKKAGQLKLVLKNTVETAQYEIKYSTSKKFVKSRTKILHTSKKNNTIKKLKKGKIYYLKVRAYNIDTIGNKIYGKWSGVKRIKIKL